MQVGLFGVTYRLYQLALTALFVFLMLGAVWLIAISLGLDVADWVVGDAGT